MSSGWIVALVVIAVVGIGGYIGYRSVKAKIERVSMAMFGTKSITKGLERQADILAETPKSVSGMTRIFEPQIRRDFPDFNLVQFKNKAENMLIAALNAITSEKPELLREASEELTRQVRNRIADNHAAGIKETYSQIKIHRTEIANYVKQAGTCIITFQSAVEHYHYSELREQAAGGGSDSRSGSRRREESVLSGDKQRKQQTKYNIELIYIQDERLAKIDNAVGTSCPHCGAPVTNLGAMYCEYCGLGITPINLKVWTLHKYYEVEAQHF